MWVLIAVILLAGAQAAFFYWLITREFKTLWHKILRNECPYASVGTRVSELGDELDRQKELTAKLQVELGRIKPRKAEEAAAPIEPPRPVNLGMSRGW